MTHPEIAAEQAHIDRAHLLLDQARDRARKLRGMVEVGRGGTTQARYERDVIEGSVQNRLGQLQLGSAALIFGKSGTWIVSSIQASRTPGTHKKC